MAKIFGALLSLGVLCLVFINLPSASGSKGGPRPHGPLHLFPSCADDCNGTCPANFECTNFTRGHKVRQVCLPGNVIEHRECFDNETCICGSCVAECTECTNDTSACAEGYVCKNITSRKLQCSSNISVCVPEFPTCDNSYKSRILQKCYGLYEQRCGVEFGCTCRHGHGHGYGPGHGHGKGQWRGKRCVPPARSCRPSFRL